ncbi:MAG: hypothetical protein Q7R39_10350 [Dehalococcoidia bacterium]|nr:hypothetical protein [Dehalococcoidia bacterium]
MASYDEAFDDLAGIEELFIMAALVAPWRSQHDTIQIIKCAGDVYTMFRSIPGLLPNPMPKAHERVIDRLAHEVSPRGPLSTMVSVSRLMPKFTDYLCLHMGYAYGRQGVNAYGRQGVNYAPPPTSQFRRFFQSSDADGNAQGTIGERRDLYLKCLNASATLEARGHAANDLQRMSELGYKSQFIPVTWNYLVPVQGSMKFTTLVLANWVRIFFRATLMADTVAMKVARGIFYEPATDYYFPIAASSLP